MEMGSYQMVSSVSLGYSLAISLLRMKSTRVQFWPSRSHLRHVAACHAGRMHGTLGKSKEAFAWCRRPTVGWKVRCSEMECEKGNEEGYVETKRVGGASDKNSTLLACPWLHLISVMAGPEPQIGSCGRHHRRKSGMLCRRCFCAYGGVRRAGVRAAAVEVGDGHEQVEYTADGRQQ